MPAAGAAVGGLDSIGGLAGLPLGATAGVTTGVAGALVRRTARPRAAARGGSLPLAVAGPVAYVLGRILVG